MTFERRLAAAVERLSSQQPTRYTKVDQPEGLEGDALATWRAEMLARCEREGVVPIVIVRTHGAEP